MQTLYYKSEQKIFFADDIVLVGDNWEEVESRYTRWKKALQEKGMKINVNKTKAFYTKRNFVRMQMQKYPCSVCGKEVGRNSVQCTKCQHWMHKELFWGSLKFNPRKEFYL